MGKRVRQGDPKRAIGYVRVSTSEQHLGPRAQAAALDAWASREGVQLVAVCIDRGVSGKTPLSERPGLVEALAALEGASAGVLVAAKRDRLARDIEVVRPIERAAAKYGAVVRTADGTSDAQGSQGVIQRGLHDLLGEWEREIIRERTTAALAIKKARGERVGQVPFGWRVADDGVRLVPVEHELQVLRKVRDLKSRKLSTRAIVAALDQCGMRNRAGGRFAQTQVMRLIRAAMLLAT
jgi:DNA invertase Pin-like site-specific DNA recombinase